MERTQLTRRDFGKIALAGSLYTLTSCGGGGGGGKKRNQLPAASIARSFTKNGKVNYAIIGHDNDGQVIEIQTKYNEENLERYHVNNIEITKPIDKEMNHLEVVVTDNKGGRNTSGDSFEVPKKEVAYGHIKQMLDNARGFLHYLSDASEKVPIYLEDTKILVDFLITRNDERFSVVNYTSLEDNLEEEINNQKSVHGFFIDNLYLFRLPIDEITKRMQDFIKSGYTTKFEN